MKIKEAHNLIGELLILSGVFMFVGMRTKIFQLNKEIDTFKILKLYFVILLRFVSIFND